MKMRIKALLPVGALAGAFGLSSAASAQQSGTADNAKALLAKAAIAVKADEAGALARFDNPNGGYKDRDLYVFCFDRRSGVLLAGQPTTKGKGCADAHRSDRQKGRPGDVRQRQGRRRHHRGLSVPQAQLDRSRCQGILRRGAWGRRLRGRLLHHLRSGGRRLIAKRQGSTMPVPSSWGSISRDPSIKHASVALIRPYPS
jgi:hypothetical protein